MAHKKLLTPVYEINKGAEKYRWVLWQGDCRTLPPTSSRGSGENDEPLRLGSSPPHFHETQRPSGTTGPQGEATKTAEGGRRWGAGGRRRKQGKTNILNGSCGKGSAWGPRLQTWGLLWLLLLLSITEFTAQIRQSVNALHLLITYLSGVRH